MISFLGSDVHRQKSIYLRMPSVLEALEETIGEEKLKELSFINPKLVLEDKEIEIEEPIEIKEKRFFGKLFLK